MDALLWVDVKNAPKVVTQGALWDWQIDARTNRRLAGSWKVPNRFGMYFPYKMPKFPRKTTMESAVSLRRIEDLPSPRGLPYVGNLLQIDPPRMHRQLEDWCSELGPIYRLQLGPRPVVVLGDHEAIAAVLRDRPDGFGRTSRLEEIGNELGLLPGVFGVNGDVWRRQRRMVMASFSPGPHQALLPVPCRGSPAVGKALEPCRSEGRLNRPAGRPDAIHGGRGRRACLRG